MWTGTENFAYTRNRSPDPSERSGWLYRLHYPDTPCSVPYSICVEQRHWGMEFIKHLPLVLMLRMRGVLLPYLYFFKTRRFVKHGDDCTFCGDVSVWPPLTVALVDVVVFEEHFWFQLGDPQRNFRQISLTFASLTSYSILIWQSGVSDSNIYRVI